MHCAPNDEKETPPIMPRCWSRGTPKILRQKKAKRGLRFYGRKLPMQNDISCRGGSCCVTCSKKRALFAGFETATYEVEETIPLRGICLTILINASRMRLTHSLWALAALVAMIQEEAAAAWAAALSA